MAITCHYHSTNHIYANIIRNAWDGASKLAPGSRRKEQTKIINNAFIRDQDGRLVENPDAPIFQEWATRTNTSSKADEVGGLPNISDKLTRLI